MPDEESAWVGQATIEGDVIVVRYRMTNEMIATAFIEDVGDELDPDNPTGESWEDDVIAYANRLGRDGLRKLLADRLAYIGAYMDDNVPSDSAADFAGDIAATVLLEGSYDPD